MPSAADTGDAPSGGFTVDLDVYSGPFDVLLGMVANRRLELTEVSLSAITEEFLDYARGLDFAADMDEASSFLDIAAILVEAKSAALLPADSSGEYDAQSMEALRERDLLFSRLLQYRAFKRAAAEFRVRIAANAGRFAHPGRTDGTAAAALLPELVWTLGADEFAGLAARVLASSPVAEVSTHQLHVPLVDLEEQARLVRARLDALGEGGSLTFAQLADDARGRAEVVARFLAVLALFKQGLVQFRQNGPYETLHLRWMPRAKDSADASATRDDDGQDEGVSEDGRDGGRA
ncbi:segregation and condensation protein A [Bifidobacterium aesculapii]|uniref:segregation and condensation protein A n=1 Tax=Bifidobacterium aesculapii TaxID=1329411 RepID=UPI0006E35994|nr:ScpA family protein [Bifidobacterium aesculapii]